IQEELIEKEIAYLDLLETQRGPRMRQFLTAETLLGSGALAPTPGRMVGATLFQFYSRPGELPTLFKGPLEGTDAKGEPWMHPSTVLAVKVRLGRVRQEAPPPVAPGGGAPPSGPGGAAGPSSVSTTKP